MIRKLIENRISVNLIEAYLPSLRMPANIEITPEILERLKSVNWTDINVDQAGDDGQSIIHLQVNIPSIPNPEVSKGIIVDIQLIHQALYQIHISLAKQLQGLGLGPKIYKAVIMSYGHLYSGVGRRHNPIVNKIWDALKNDSELDCYQNELGDLCVKKGNPDTDRLLNLFGGTK